MDDLTNDLINAIVPYGEAIDLEIVRAKFQVILAGYNILPGTIYRSSHMRLL